MSAPTSGGTLQNGGANYAEDADLDLVIGDVVSQIIGMDRDLCRRRWQQSPPLQPDRDTDWCAVGVTSIEPDQNVAAELVGEVYTVHLHETVDVLLSFYGLNATQNAMTFKVGIALGINRGILNDNGLAFLRVSEVRRIPATTHQLTLMRTDVSVQYRSHETRPYPIPS